MGLKSIGHAFSKGWHSVERPTKKAVTKVGKAIEKPFHHMLDGMKATAGQDAQDAQDITEEPNEILRRTEENAKKARAKLFATSGGVLGEEVENVQTKAGRRIFGN